MQKGVKRLPMNKEKTTLLLHNFFYKNYLLLFSACLKSFLTQLSPKDSLLSVHSEFFQCLWYFPNQEGLSQRSNALKGSWICATQLIRFLSGICKILSSGTATSLVILLTFYSISCLLRGRNLLSRCVGDFGFRCEFVENRLGWTNIFLFPTMEALWGICFAAVSFGSFIVLGC